MRKLMTAQSNPTQADEAKAQWMRCWHTFGPDDPWVDVEDISEFDSTEFPAYIAE